MAFEADSKAATLLLKTPRVLMTNVFWSIWASSQSMCRSSSLRREDAGR